jgi:flagellin-like hook-associated protein FlgL
MVINTNSSAQTSARLLNPASSVLAKSLARLSSGIKIVSPEDDAAGAYSTDVSRKQFKGVDLGHSAYNTATGSSMESASNAPTALTNVKAAPDQLATDRANVGGNLSRLSSTSEGLSVLRDNVSAANSRIKDADIAEESTSFARYNILVPAGTAMLAQANSTPQLELRFLQ